MAIFSQLGHTGGIEKQTTFLPVQPTAGGGRHYRIGLEFSAGTVPYRRGDDGNIAGHGYITLILQAGTK